MAARRTKLIDDERLTVGRLVQQDGDSPPLIHVTPEASVRQALNLMSTTTSQLPVLDGDDGVALSPSRR